MDLGNRQATQARPETAEGQLTLFPANLALDYSIRESRRARTVRLHMTLQDGLVIVIPAGYNRRLIPGIIKHKLAWIEKSRLWAEDQRRLMKSASRLRLPRKIEFKAAAETWMVLTRNTQAKRVSAREQGAGAVMISGQVDDIKACLAALNRWTGRRARRFLVPWLEDLSREIGYGYERAIIGNQRSLWGSCSRLGTISLNRKLLFLPDRLVRYVLIHELCHVSQMNHSKRFWSSVSRHEPGWLELRRELGDSWRLIPAWIENL